MLVRDLTHDYISYKAVGNQRHVLLVSNSFYFGSYKADTYTCGISLFMHRG